MFPLHLLGLLFITPRIDDKKVREKEMERRTGMENGKAEEKGRVRSQMPQGRVLERGDLLEVPRTMFTHFGIYLGGGRVAHLIPDILPVFSNDQRAITQMVTNLRLLLGVLAKVASVRVDNLEDFAYGSEIIVNRMDKVCSRRPLLGEEVVRRAETLQGSGEYSLLWWNCEHYVMYCRYATVISFQTSQFCKTARKYILSRRSAYLTAVFGAFLIFCLDMVTVYSAFATVIVAFLVWMAA